MANKHAGTCPYCGETVTPVLIEENRIRRDVCKCPSWGSDHIAAKSAIHPINFLGVFQR